MSFSRKLRRPTLFTFAALAALCVTVLGMSSPPPLGAAEPQAILARGFEPDQIYDFNGIDNVNLFNGNLVVTIPIGQRYPVNAGFEYGFTLVYNSEIWDYVIDCPGDGVDELGQPGAPTLVITDPASASQACGGGSPPQRALRGIPNPKSNAGTSWRLTLGELYAPTSALSADGTWTFVGPDGAERSFLPQEGSQAESFPQYTRDGSHMRLSDSGVSPACAEVGSDCTTIERPDGVVYAFEPIESLAGWRLRRIEDRFGNGVSITYPGTSWRVEDTVGRVHWVDFDASGVMMSLRLAAFGGQTAQYDFTTHATAPMLPGCPHDFDIEGVSESRSLTLLDSISMPDGSRYGFSYADDDGSTGPCTHFEGRLERMDLPTGGSIEYEYGQYQFPIKPCDPPPVQQGGVSSLFLTKWGVTHRTAHEIDDTILADTRYVNGGASAAPTKQSYVMSGVEICIQPRTTFTDVYEKADQGHFKLTRNFFAIAQSQGDGSAGADPDRLPGETFRYGLPIDHITADGTTSRYRSSMVFDCPGFPDPSETDYGPSCATGGGSGCWPAEAWHLRIPTSCYDVDKDGDPENDRFLFADEVQGLRDTYLEHESGDVHYCDGNPATNPDCEHANWRVKSDRTYFYDSTGDSYLQTARSGFDGYGHYRTTVSSSNSPGSVSHTTYMDFDPVHTSATWLLGLVDETKVTESSQTSRETFSYDRTTGFLETRRMKGDGRDLVATFTPDDFGNVETESYSGGDPGQPGYEIVNAYSNGSLSSSSYLDGADPILRTVDADIDPSTGLPTASRDATNLETKYTFDAMGRLTRMAQQGSLAEAATDYDYDPFDAMTGARATVAVTRGDTTAQVFFDGLGRANEARTKRPDGSFNRRFTSFTTMGQPKAVTTLHPVGTAASAFATETDYDVFGRPVEIRNPDDAPGAGHDSKVTFFYDGIFKTVRRMHDVETPDGPRRLQTRFSNDHQGRLLSVEDTELSADGTGSTLKLTTRYGYDEMGRLTRVNQGGGTQVRTFSYDGAGLLTRECHPELDGGCIDYGGFDARGNPTTLRYTQAAGAPFGLDYVRDAAGRLTQVKSAQDARMLKELFYNDFYESSQGFGPSDGNGKLYQARRHNYLGPLDIVATTTHSYSGVGGRLSHRTTATGGDGDVPRVHFTTHFSYDALGNLTDVTYPSCLQTGCAAEAPYRKVHDTYTRGLLTTVGTPADPDRYAALAYHPNLTLARVTHGNGVVDDIAQDAHQMPRPGGVEVRKGATAGSGPLWQASYAYDGAGNLTSRQSSGYTDSGALRFSGTDLFRYDPVFDRLVSATIHYPASAGGASDSRSFSYDPFGNLQAISGSASRTFTPDPATNRLEAPFTYDAAGNLTSQIDPDASGPGNLSQWFYSYDPFHMMTRAFRQAGSVTRQYIYTADDERLATLTSGRELWTLRGANAQVLRDVEYASTGWRWIEDYVHRGSGLLATESDAGTGTQTRHYHLDHLGSPRLVTGPTKQVLARHVYAPYGEELTSPLQDDLRMKFTGHERDRMDVTASAGDLDYMHARYYSGSMGRFLSVDPKSRREPLPASQVWNRYAYAVSNPLRFLDPDGLAVQDFTLLTEGPNNVPIPGFPDVLGLEQNADGFHLNTNVQIDFDEGDDLDSYTVERDAFTLAPQEVYKKGPDENPDDPGPLSRTGSTMFVYDGPGITVTRDGRPAPRRAMGSGNYISFYQIRVLDKDTKKYDPTRFYFAISVTYKDGKAISYAVKEVTEEEYQEQLARVKE